MSEFRSISRRHRLLILRFGTPDGPAGCLGLITVAGGQHLQHYPQNIPLSRIVDLAAS